MKHLIVVLALVAGCGWLGSAIRTTIDIARCLCEVVAAEQPEGELAGMSPEEWCEVRENLEPFIDEVTRAKAAASRKAGFHGDSQ
jgi:hypothetical protein